MPSTSYALFALMFFPSHATQVGAKQCKKLRDLAENCGMTLDNEGGLDVEARKNIFEIEVLDCFLIRVQCSCGGRFSCLVNRYM